MQEIRIELVGWDKPGCVRLNIAAFRKQDGNTFGCIGNAASSNGNQSIYPCTPCSFSHLRHKDGGRMLHNAIEHDNSPVPQCAEDLG